MTANVMERCHPPDAHQHQRTWHRPPTGSCPSRPLLLRVSPRHRHARCPWLWSLSNKIPTLVNQALELSGDIFDNEPTWRYFAEYLTRLMVAGRKNISAINRQFAVTTDQSCRDHWLVEAPSCYSRTRRSVRRATQRQRKWWSTCENGTSDNPTGDEGQRQCVRLRVPGPDLGHR